MKKLLPLVFLIFLFYSCGDDTQPVITEPENVYEFQSIKYSLEEGDGIKMDTVTIFNRDYFNKTSIAATVKIDVPDQNETSQFLSNKKSTVSLQTNDSLKIAVPILINGNTIFTSTHKWKYSEGKEEVLPHTISNSSETYSLTPNTKLTVNIYAIRQNITTSYIATFEEKKTGEIVNIEGKWNGTQITGFDTYAIYNEIK